MVWSPEWCIIIAPERGANGCPGISGRPRERSSRTSFTGPAPFTLSFNSKPASGTLAYSKIHLPLGFQRETQGISLCRPFAHASRTSLSGAATPMERAWRGDDTRRESSRVKTSGVLCTSTAVGGTSGNTGASWFRKLNGSESGKKPFRGPRCGALVTYCAIQESTRLAELAHSALPASASSAYNWMLGLGCSSVYRTVAAPSTRRPAPTTKAPSGSVARLSPAINSIWGDRTASPRPMMTAMATAPETVKPRATHKPCARGARITTAGSANRHASTAQIHDGESSRNTGGATKVDGNDSLRFHARRPTRSERKPPASGQTNT